MPKKNQTQPPPQCGHVEVVGGLIQQQQVAALPQHAREVQAVALTAWRGAGRAGGLAMSVGAAAKPQGSLAGGARCVCRVRLGTLLGTALGF